MKKPRLKPYTTIGIKRVKCFRCNNKSCHQWNICADNSATGKARFRPMCLECDIELNKLILHWTGFTNAKELGKEYERKARLSV